jgi:phage shock protein C
MTNSEQTTIKQLRRTTGDRRMLFGVCGGVSEYFGIDANLVRIVFVAAIFAGIGLPVYAAAWILIPEDRD